MSTTQTKVPAGTWNLDPVHSAVGFEVDYLAGTFRGQFRDVQAELGIADSGARIEGSAEVASVDVKDENLAAHLQSPDFFDAERFPQITFRSTRIEGNPPKQEGDRFRLAGDLVIHGSSMEVVLDCGYEGRGTDPWGKTRAGFSCRTEIDRREWGLKWNQAIETGGVLVANKVRVEGEVQFVRQEE